MTRIGFMGPKGTFSHEAADRYINGRKGMEAIDCATIQDAILGVQNASLDEALAPIENSLEGAVNTTLDMLAWEEGLQIKAELVIPVVQNLLVKKGTRPQDIKIILSHVQPIGQCRKYLNDRFPSVQIGYTYSTATAAAEVAAGSGGMAAIGSAAAADIYGLEVLERGIQDGDNNFTRFVVVSRMDSQPTGRDKTSIVFSTENRPGSLYRILDIFNLWDINMTKIESRPAKKQLGSYIFFIDIEGHRCDQDVADALTMVKRKTSFFKLLGSYPVWDLDC